MRLSRGSSGAVPHVEAGPRLRPMQIESWRLLRQEYADDRAAQADRRAWQSHRARVRPDLAALIGRFLTGGLDVGALRATFDRRTKTDWGAFGLQGTSGAMFHPANDHPIDKASYRFEITVPRGLEAISNGELKKRPTWRSKTTWVWRGASRWPRTSR